MKTDKPNDDIKVGTELYLIDSSRGSANAAIQTVTVIGAGPKFFTITM